MSSNSKERIFIIRLFSGWLRMPWMIGKENFPSVKSSANPLFCSSCKNKTTINQKKNNFSCANMLQANQRQEMTDTSPSVQCMRCWTVRSLACFVGTSWRAEPSDSQMTSEFQTEKALMLKSFADNASAMRGTDSSLTVYQMMSMRISMCRFVQRIAGKPP